MEGEKFDEEYDPSNNKCPVCGESYAVILGKTTWNNVIVGTEDYISHKRNETRYLHKED